MTEDSTAPESAPGEVAARAAVDLAPVPEAPGWKRVLGNFGGVFLGAVLLIAAGAKTLDPAAFADQITAEGLDFLLPAGAVALFALALEV
ncbi:MAG: hypothetical protein V3T72_12480, partial [Thermoanaerobaculia bacterium]